jgi:hypothetical protein
MAPGKGGAGADPNRRRDLTSECGSRQLARDATVTLANDEIRLVADPALGGRVVALTDRRRDREWLVAGDAATATAAWAAETAPFGGPEAFGWDECLPTVAPCPDPLHPGGPALRDHGDQWGRPADVDLASNALTTAWPSGRWPYRFVRRIELDGPIMTVDYRLTNDGRVAIPFLWAMHALLALEPGAVVQVVRPGALRITSTQGDPPPPIAGGAEWHVPDGPTGTYLKAYARLVEPGRVIARQPDGATLSFEWDRVFAPVVGLWLDFGGWPEAAPVWQAAVEPTTSEDDDLRSAIEAGRARLLPAAASVGWSVRLAFG